MRYCIIFILLFSCAPNKIIHVDKKPQTIKEIPSYDIKEKIDSIPKPPMPKKQYAKVENGKISFSNQEDSTHVMYSWEEAKKINALKDLAIAYKAIIMEQETLINSYITQLNILNNIYILEVDKSNTYHSMYVESENAYKEEAYYHKWDNGINRIGIYAITIGSLIILITL